MTADGIAAIVVAIAALAVFGFILLGARRSMRRAEQQAAERAARARELGWSYSDAKNGDIVFRFSGSCEGMRWELVYDSRWSQADSSAQIVWRWREKPARRTELAILGAMADQIAFGALSRKVIDLAGRLGVKGPRQAGGDDFYQIAQRVQSDLRVFQAEWIVRARKPALFKGIASHELADLLTRWPDHSMGRAFTPAAAVNLLYDHEGLKLECSAEVSEMALIEHLVKIGCTVARRLRAVELDRV